MEKNLDIKKVYKDLDIAIFDAVNNPIDLKELNSISEKAKLFEAEGGTKEGRDEFYKKLSKSQITCKTLPEYRYVLEKLGYTKAGLEYVLKHENAHGNMAEFLNAENRGYVVIIYK